MPVCKVCNKRAYSEYCLKHKPRMFKKMPEVSFKFKPCKVCGSKYHYATFCPQVQKRPVPMKKRVIERGKGWTTWSLIREDWYEKFGQYHPCHYCGMSLQPGTITLDHKIPRSRAPELRYVFDNLVPACGRCNLLKGSVAHDEYVHTCHG